MTPPGSSGTPSRPATTRLLILPALSRAAQAARRSAAACTTVSGNWAMFPLRLVNLAWMSIVPGVDSAEEALTRLSLVRKVSAKIPMLPPGPPKASARI